VDIDYELTLVGEGSLKGETMLIGKDMNIKFIDSIPNNKIDKFYQKHNLFVLPSRSDPVGMVVFEAMSNGLPCIISENVGAGRDINYPSSFRFESGNYKELAYCIRHWEELDGKESLKILKEIHNPKKIKKQLISVLS